MRSQIRSLAVAGRNAQDGVSLVQTAEGALQRDQQQPDPHARARHPGRQRHADDRATARRSTTSSRQLIDEIDRIAAQTTFNGVNLLDGSTTTVVDPGRHAGRRDDHRHVRRRHRGDAGPDAATSPPRRTPRPTLATIDTAIDLGDHRSRPTGRDPEPHPVGDLAAIANVAREPVRRREPHPRRRRGPRDRRPDPQLDPAAGRDLRPGAGQRAAAARAVAARARPRLADGGGRSAPPPRPAAGRATGLSAPRAGGVFFRSRIQFRFRAWADMRPRREAVPEDGPQAPLRVRRWEASARHGPPGVSPARSVQPSIE